jgi:hypothetical protein
LSILDVIKAGVLEPLAGSGSGTGFGGGEEARFGSRVKYALEVVELFGCADRG